MSGKWFGFRAIGRAITRNGFTVITCAERIAAIGTEIGEMIGEMIDEMTVVMIGGTTAAITSADNSGNRL
jgi:hypothetical protein